MAVAASCSLLGLKGDLNGPANSDRYARQALRWVAAQSLFRFRGGLLSMAALSSSGTARLRLK